MIAISNTCEDQDVENPACARMRDPRDQRQGGGDDVRLHAALAGDPAAVRDVERPAEAPPQPPRVQPAVAADGSRPRLRIIRRG